MLSNFATGTGRSTEVFLNRGAGRDSVPVPALRSMVATNNLFVYLTFKLFRILDQFEVLTFPFLSKLLLCDDQ